MGDLVRIISTEIVKQSRLRYLVLAGNEIYGIATWKDVYASYNHVMAYLNHNPPGLLSSIWISVSDL